MAIIRPIFKCEILADIKRTFIDKKQFSRCRGNIIFDDLELYAQ